MAEFCRFADGKMRDPNTWCPKCGSRFGVIDEQCDSCGLDPVNDEADAEFYQQALEQFLSERGEPA